MGLHGTVRKNIFQVLISRKGKRVRTPRGPAAVIGMDDYKCHCLFVDDGKA